MNWTEILIPIASAVGGALGGAWLASRMRGKPPAPRDRWEAERQGSDKATGRR